MIVTAALVVAIAALVVLSIAITLRFRRELRAGAPPSSEETNRAVDRRTGAATDETPT